MVIMAEIRIHKGWLSLREDGNYHETVELDGEPIADELEYMSGKVVTVKYYISDKEATEEELKEDFLINTLYGNLESEYGAVYSEITGYLWTNDDLKVGGHDLRKEFESYVGKYLYLTVEIDEEVEKKKEIERNLRNYNSTLNNLVYLANQLGKTIDEVIQDLCNLK